jgi:hypothetical protein
LTIVARTLTQRGRLPPPEPPEVPVCFEVADIGEYATDRGYEVSGVALCAVAH